MLQQVSFIFISLVCIAAGVLVSPAYLAAAFGAVALLIFTGG